MKSVLFFLILLLSCPSVLSSEAPFRPSRSAKRFAEKKVRKMSLDEKLGQLVHIGINARFLNRDNPRYNRLVRTIREQRVGGITVFAGGIYETVHLVNRLQHESKYPLLISADFETGVGMRLTNTQNFPWNMAIAATGDEKLAERLGYLTALESRATGVHQVFAPVVDVNNNSENPVINVRSFGEDPALVARFGVAFMRGLQRGRVLATAKHFPGHGDTDVDSHRGLPVIKLDRARLEKIELLPFRRLVKEGVASVMVSHISLPQLDSEPVRPLENPEITDYADSKVESSDTTIPATLSRKIVGGILRKEIGFDGLIVTDAMDMNGLTLFFDQGEAAVRAILAGNDVLIKPASVERTLSGLRKAAESGRLPISVIDDAVRRQIAWKRQLGLFRKRTVKLDAIDSLVSGAESRELAAEIANKSITLVKNAENVLPLKPGGKTVFLAITNGLDYVRVGRTFSNKLKTNGIDHERVVLDVRSDLTELLNARNAITKADRVIIGLYGRVRTGSASSVGIPEAAKGIVDGVLASEKKVLAVAFGNPYLLESFPALQTYVVAYGDMRVLQRATADALTGRIPFRGKLPITIAQFPAGSGITVAAGVN